MFDDVERKTIVIDNWSGYIKAGFCGEEGPRSVFSSVVGTPKYKSEFTNKSEYFIGNDAEDKRGVLILSHPIKRVMVKNWDYIEKIWDYTFKYELKADPEDYDILITHPLKNLKENVEKTAQIMFETFNVKALNLSHPTLLSLYASGKFEGMVIDFGDGTTQFSGIIDGYEIPEYSERINLGGKDITNYFDKLLNTKGVNVKIEKLDKEIIRDIKEKSGYIPLDYHEELKSLKPFDYQLPDGTHILIDEKRIKYPMSLIFNPELKWREEKSFPKICKDLIMKCEDKDREKLFGNIVLSGGNSMFKGLPEKFDKEIKALAPSSYEKIIKIKAEPERKFYPWIGGAIVSALSTSETLFVKNENYEEEGITIIEKKFA